jgi:hypothetical protein
MDSREAAFSGLASCYHRSTRHIRRRSFDIWTDQSYGFRGSRDRIGIFIFRHLLDTSHVVVGCARLSPTQVFETEDIMKIEQANQSPEPL